MTTAPVKFPWLKKRGVLLLLLFAYLLTSALVVLQQRTIESQRVLIRDLFRDSLELSQMKVKQAVVKR
jgi:hypothetical protein